MNNCQKTIGKSNIFVIRDLKEAPLIKLDAKTNSDYQ